MQIRHTPLSGGYCGEVPPLPIPNREVKLTCADGTAMQCGRVGSRLLLSRASDFERFLRLFVFLFPTDFTDGTDLLCPADKINEEPYPLSSDRIGQFVFYFLEYLLMEGIDHFRIIA